MQDVPSTGGPRGPELPPPIATPKTSDSLFQNIQDYLANSSRAKLLMESLAFLEMLSSEEIAKQGGSYKTFEEHLIPEGKIAETVLTKINNAKELLPIVQQLNFHAKNRDAEGGVEPLLSLVGRLAEPDTLPLTDTATSAVKSLTKPLLNFVGTDATLHYVLSTTPPGSTIFVDRMKQLAYDNPILGDYASPALEKSQDPAYVENLMNRRGEILAGLKEELGAAFASREVRSGLDELYQKIIASVTPAAILNATNEEREKTIYATSAEPGFEKLAGGILLYLTEGARLLQQSDPSNADLHVLIATVSQVEKTPTPEQATAIGYAIPSLFAAHDEMKQNGTLSAEDSQKFLDLSLLHTHRLATTARVEESKVETTLTSVRTKAEALPDVQSNLSEVQRALENIIDGNRWNPQQLSNIAETLVDLAKQNSLSDQDRQKLEQFFSLVAKINAGIPLPIVLATSQMGTWITDFASQNRAPLQTADLKQWLNQKINDLNQTKMANPLWKEFVSALQKEMTQSGFPGVLAENGAPFGKVLPDGSFEPNAALQASLPQTLELDPESAEKALSELTDLQVGVDERTSNLATETKGLYQAKVALTQTNQNLQLAAANVQTKRLAEGAPTHPLLTSSAIKAPPDLKSLMSSAEAKMSPTTLQELMSLQNLLNNLQYGLQNYSLSDFLSKYIVQTAGGQMTFNIPANQVLSMIQKEMGSATSDLASLRAALSKLNTLIAQLQQQQKTNPSTEVQKLLQQLQNQAINIQQQIPQMNQLIAQLKAMQAAVASQGGNARVVIAQSDWQQLISLETHVKGGDPHGTPPYDGIGDVYNFFQVAAWQGVSEELYLLQEETSGFSFSNFNIAQYFSLLPDGTYNIAPQSALALFSQQLASITKDLGIAKNALQQVNALLTELKNMQPQTPEIKNLIAGLTKQQNSLTQMVSQMQDYINNAPAVIAAIKADISAGATTTAIPQNLFKQLNVDAFNIFNGSPADNYGGIKDIQGYFFKLTWESINIATEFVQAIDTYMNGQNAIVSQLNSQLSYLNTIGQKLNDIAQTCQNFQFAANNYDLSSFFPVESTSGGNTTYNITVSAATAAVNKEIAALTADTKNIGVATGQINNTLTYLQGQPQTTQVKQLESKLKTELNTLSAQYGNFGSNTANLIGYLDQIKNALAKQTGTSKAVLPSTMVPQVTNVETLIVQGSSTYGSLSSVQGDFTNLKGDYATLSQRQQMMLQMTMTEVQQEWTMVTSALQTLMEMYKTIVQTLAVR